MDREYLLPIRFQNNMMNVIDIGKCSHTEICQICDKNIQETFELYLDGTDDVYHLEVCDSCYKLYGEDYISPEEIDKLLNKEKEEVIE